MKTIKTITIIGSGNVASHIGIALFNKGFSINEVYSPSIEHATLLALLVGAQATNQLNKLNTESDFYLVCIKDDAIDKVLSDMTIKDKIIAHTSGSIDLNVFETHGFKHYGIFYPLQTFSKNKKVNIAEVPFCIEANTAEDERLLMNLAKELSEKVYLVSSEQRKKIHLAAVFACNFTNYMYAVADDLLSKNDLDFDILKPLIIETAQKVMYASPKSMQTGPAKRNDEAVIKNHIEMLEGMKEYQDIYKIISDKIKNA